MSTPPDLPLCVDCKHLLGIRSKREEARQWKCAHPSNILLTTRDIVSGVLQSTFKKNTCYETRDEEGVCGPAGQLFALYEPPVYKPSAPASRPKGAIPSADALLGELGQ